MKPATAIPDPVRCGIGLEAQCCVFLVCGADGLECARHGPLDQTIRDTYKKLHLLGESLAPFLLCILPCSASSSSWWHLHPDSLGHPAHQAGMVPQWCCPVLPDSVHHLLEVQMTYREVLDLLGKRTGAVMLHMDAGGQRHQWQLTVTDAVVNLLSTSHASLDDPCPWEVTEETPYIIHLEPT